MAYRCRECGSGFTRGCAFRTHQHVHARVQGQQGRVRFAGTEPYDPSEYPARVLARDDDDADGGGGGGSDVEDPTSLPNLCVLRSPSKKRSSYVCVS